MKILITGHLGFVGSETTRLLQELGYQIIGYDILEKNDIRDSENLKQTIEQTKPDRILHLAAVARFSDADHDPWLAYETNVLGTKNISYLAAHYHIPLVYASTGSVYMPIQQAPPITEEFPIKGNSVYGCSKAVGEKYVEKYGVPYIILRYAHLYGKEKRGHGLIGGFMQRIERGLSPTLYGGKQSNDFTYIKDIARANYMALTASWDKWNQAYNIGTGEELTAEQAGKIICKAAKYKGKIEIKEQRNVDPQRFVYDTTKAEQILGFKAQYSFEKGLQDMFS